MAATGVTYSGAIEALTARGRFGMRLGLGRTKALLRALGSPELDLRGVLVGGTNGKGSTGAMVAAALRAGGLRVGQTPKPHLVSYRERIVVDGRAIAASDFAALVAEVLNAADGLAPRLGAPTEFEALTAAALLWFARVGVEVAVVEVGLGGRLDATNAWDGGVAVITNVQRDHMEHLGDTLEAIAREKAAIIKRGDRAVSAAIGEPLQVIRRRARRMGVPLSEVEPLVVTGMDRSGTRVEHPRLGPLRLGLLGRHQAANAATAIATLEALRVAGIASLDDSAVRRGVEGATWPGRLELLTEPIEVLLDGAHNEAGARALASAIDELKPSLSPGRATLLLGILRDKEVAAMIEALSTSRVLRDGLVIVTTVPDTTRALPAAELALAWGPGSRVVAEPDEALDTALAAARSEGGPLIVAGSLYLVGHARGRLVDEPDLRDPP